MNYIEKTFQTMADDAAAYARKNEVVWNAIPVIVTQVTTIEQKVQALHDAVYEQSREDSSGMVDDKHIKFDALVSAAYKLERKLSFFAKKTGNSILLKEVSMSENDLSRLDDTKLPNKCKTILELGQSYLSQTQTDYGITATELDSLAAAITEAETLPTQIDLAKNDDKMSTQNIKTLIPEIRNEFDSLDDAFEGMITDETFLAGWWAIRKIKGRHHSKTAPAPAPSTVAKTEEGK